jgi:glycosyltransferase involved in cell wall biosynthesis
MKATIGIYDLQLRFKGGGNKRTLVMADHLSRGYDVRLFADRPLDLGMFQSYFGVNLSRVDIVVLKKPHRLLDVAWRLLRRKRMKRLSEQVSHFHQIQALKLDVFINNSYGDDLICPAPRGIYMCMFPPAAWPPADKNKGWLPRAYHSFMDRAEKSMLGRRTRDALGSYSIVTANSCYTAEWIEKLWGLHSKVVYSVCDDMGPAARKEKIILNVGRFAANAAGNYYKRQEVLLDVFKGLTDLHRDGWQLHFAGSIARDNALSRLTRELVEAAKGYPVVFHFNADLDALRTLYRKAAIYWHATGYGVSVRPELQEHFGLTTVEAMSAGAVPVVIDSGGQRETVTHGVDGLRWNDLASLVAQTRLLISDAQLLNRLSRQAVLASANFSRAAFTARMDQIIESLLSADATSPGISG